MTFHIARCSVAISVFSFVVGLWIALGILSKPAFSQTIASSTCPLTWINTIEMVAKARASQPIASKGVLVSGIDGEVYNCLDEKVPAKELKEIARAQRSLAQVMAETRAEDPNEYLGLCDCGLYKSQTGFKINICNLPYDEIELKTVHCTKRLEIYLKNLQ
ncbi:hypothetical protein ABWH98_25550 [Labrenzia sp. ac12]|jgi:hypothetical protein|uniref:hypothetical protein n=1 Tax=Labrenzia sp. THAF35 TaxID=2587854 RepID=UPI0012686F9D|nr:hypothetical protein [Labrenzia sp. THAF35]QFT70405.1 hypothetical protein FIU93_26695 [Labrenzia sp. THAF35]